MKVQKKRVRTNRMPRRESADWHWPADEREVRDLIDSLESLFSALGLKNSIRLSTKSKRDAQRKRHALPSATIVGNLLTNWHQDARYLDRFGEPLSLPFDGHQLSFKRLCQKVAPAESARHVLNEFIKLGVLEKDSHGLVKPTTRSLPMYNDSQLASVHTIRALRDFASTLEHNLRKADSPRDHLFFRMAWNGDLPTTKIPRLKIWLRRHGQDLLESADSWMADAARSAEHKKRKKQSRTQTSIGIYLAVQKRSRTPRTRIRSR